MRKIFSQKKIVRKMIFVSVFMIFAGSFSFAILPTQNTFADDKTTQNNIDEICKNNPASAVCADIKDQNAASNKLNDTLQNVINVLLYVAGIIAVVMIIISGLRMVSSRGNPETVKKSRNTLLYSIIGLVIAVMAFAIVNFVLARL
jgi:type IV secretory pathway VirB2 component (pilin)